MQAKDANYLLEFDSASLVLIRRYAQQGYLSIGDATLLRAQLSLELRQLALGITPQKRRREVAA